MNTSKTAVVVNSILGKIASIFGYAMGLFWLLVIIVNEWDLSSDDEIITLIIVLIILGLCVFSVIKGIQIKRRIKRFKKYVGLISSEHMTSIENIASSTSQSIDFVQNDLQKMIDKKFFVDATIDRKNNEIIINHATSKEVQQNVQIENEIVKCSGCGAINTKQKDMSCSCEYCGSTI